MNKISLLSLFSGIGSPEQALKNINIDYELVNFCEKNEFAIKSYCAVHGVDEKLNLGDIKEFTSNRHLIEKLPKDITLIVGGSPCTSLSKAGKREGMDEGSSTSSSLLWCVKPIYEHCKPKIIIWENVPDVLNKKNKHNFDKYLKMLEDLGYENFYEVLNSVNFCIPQDRKRVFVVSIKTDCHVKFQFPNCISKPPPIESLLETTVPEEFYIDVSSPKNKIQNIALNEINLYTYDHISMGYSIRSREFESSGWKNISPTLRARDNKDPINIIIPSDKGASIRKLTPKEYWRFMGFNDEQYFKAKEKCSNNQLYIQAGNSIVVPVLEQIFINLDLLKFI